jgi:hypothetical protein
MKSIFAVLLFILSQLPPTQQGKEKLDVFGNPERSKAAVKSQPIQLGIDPEVTSDEEVTSFLLASNIPVDDVTDGVIEEAAAEAQQPQVSKIKPTGPEQDLEVVLKWLETLPEEQGLSLRFLSLHAIPADRRDKAAAVVSGIINGLHWNPLVPLVVVPGSDGRILTIDLYAMSRNETDYKRLVQTWDLLSQADPYYLPPWCNIKQTEDLRTYTGSIGSILRADFFCFYATLEDDLTTKNVIEGFYSRFLGLPEDEAELLKLLDIREEKLKLIGVDRRAAITESGTNSDGKPVALNNRYVTRLPTITSAHGGYYWTTSDFINSIGARNVYNDLLTRGKDGGEIIFSLPNHMQAYFLVAAQQVQGKTVFKRIAQVPDNIAVDRNFYHERVKISTCAACHPKGINRFKCVIADELLRPGPPGGLITLTEYKAFDANRVKQLYNADLLSLVLADQTNYVTSLLQATGMTPEQYSSAYITFISGYENSITSTQACWEFGVEDISQAGIEAYLADKVVSTTRGNLLALVKGGLIKRDAFEQEYANGKLLQEIKQNIIRKGGLPKIDLVVPSTVIGQAQSINIPLESNWMVRTPGRDGKSQDFGPLDDEVLGRWFTEGRINEKTLLKDADDKSGTWKPAIEWFPGYFASKVSTGKSEP